MHLGLTSPSSSCFFFLHKHCSLRTAAFVDAIRKVARSYAELGVFP